MEIQLTQGYVAHIDPQDFCLVGHRKWHALVNKKRGTAYAMASPSRYTRVAMHRIIMAAKLGRVLGPDEIPEHADRNGLNNRRDNLRLANRAQNKANQKKYKGCSCPYKGVTYRRDTRVVKPWRARITLNGKTRLLGDFRTAEEARDAYNAAAVKVFGEFARPA